jgi:hypothetical protein
MEPKIETTSQIKVEIFFSCSAIIMRTGFCHRAEWRG